MVNVRNAHQRFLVTFALVTAVLFALVFSTTNVEAATEKFSDIKEGESGYDEVMSLVDKEIVKGYEDGTFRPYTEVSRQHVALLLKDTLKLPVPKDISKVLSAYDDVSVNHEYAEEIAAVTEAEIFKGHHGSFLPRKSINREQMASVVVKAFHLTGNDTTVNLIDIEKVSPTHQENVKVLAQNGVTIGQLNSKGERYYDPFNRLKRVQFAILLDRTIQLSHSIDSVTDKQVTINGSKYEVSDSLEGIFNAENNEVLKNAKITFETKNNKIEKVTFLELNNDGTGDKSLVLKADDNTITGDVVVNGNYVTIQNLKITKDLIVIGEGFEGDGITVDGETVIGEAEVKAASLAAAQNTVSFKNSTLATLKINKSGIHVNAQGTTTFEEIIISQNAIVTSEDGVVIPKLTVTGDAEEVEVNGEVRDLEVNTDQTTLTGNANIENLVVEGNGSLTINSSGDIANLELKSDAKVTIESDVKIGNVVLPEGSKVEDVIENYEEVKEQVEQIGGQPNPDAPTPPVSGGGGGGGSTGPTDSQAYAKLLNDIDEANDGETVTLARNITVDKTINIDKKIKLDGRGHTITFTGDLTGKPNGERNAILVSANEAQISNLTVQMNNKTEGWQGIYVMQVYKAADVELDKVTLKNADAGLLVNESEVTVNNIATSGNEFGGIEVSKGSKADKESTSNLTVTGQSEHDENLHIWTIGDATVVYGGKLYKSGEDIRSDKKDYTNYILASEVRPVPHTEKENSFDSKLNDLTVNVTQRVGNEDDKGGVSVSLGWSTLGDFAEKKATDVLDYLKITLYKGDKELVTNVLTDRYEGSLKNATPSPFNFGTTGNDKWSWDRGAYPLDNDDDPVKPDKVVVEFKIKNGKTYKIEEEITTFN